MYYDGNVEENHERFLKNLDNSKPSVRLVSKLLKDRGYNVRIGKTTKAKTHKTWRKHADNGDLFVDDYRIEIKGLSAKFTNKHDWPFRDKFIVCAKHAWDSATPKPYAFVCLSRDKKYIAIVFGNTSSHWYVEERKDSRYDDYYQDFYFCPKGKVIFGKIVNIDKELFEHDTSNSITEQESGEHVSPESNRLASYFDWN